MHIQWFPGHMTKALRMMEENVKLVDCLIYVLDSRCIAASFNPKLNELAGGKPILYVLNKADLVEREDLNAWIKYFKDNNMQVVVCNSANGNTQKVIDGLKILNKNLIEKGDYFGTNQCRLLVCIASNHSHWSGTCYKRSHLIFNYWYTIRYVNLCLSFC